MVKRVMIEMDKNKKEKGKGKAKEEKTEDAEDEAFPKLRVKNTPKPLYDATRTLTPNQKTRLKNLGFGKAYINNLDSIPGRLPYFVVKNFDEEKMRITLDNGAFIPITANAIHDMLGIPNEGKELISLEFDPEVTAKWKLPYEDVKKKKAVINGTTVKEKIKQCQDDSYDFVLNFLVLFVNTMGLTDKMGNFDTSFVGYLKEGVDIKNINWCQYILGLVKKGKSKWNEKEEEFFSGPLSLLMVRFLKLVFIF